MGFYVGLFLFCIVMLMLSDILNTKKQRDIIGFITVVTLCIVSGTRNDLGGSDYWVYQSIFNNSPDLFEDDFFISYSGYLANYEIGYIFLNSIVKSIGISFYGFTFLLSIIFYSSLFLGLKRYISNFSILVIVFLYKMFFYDTFISMRQSISIAIFFLIIKYIYEGKPWKYFLGCIIAILFHNSAIILLPIYFIRKITLNNRKIIILNMIFLPMLLISYMHFSLLDFLVPLTNYLGTEGMQNRADAYFINNDAVGINIFHTLEYFLIMVLVIMNYNKIKQLENPYSEFIIKIFLCLLPIFTLFREYTIFTREKDFFLMTFPVILNYLMEMENKKWDIVIQVVTIIICAYGFFRFILLFDDGGLMPYTSYLFL